MSDDKNKYSNTEFERYRGERKNKLAGIAVSVAICVILAAIPLSSFAVIFEVMYSSFEPFAAVFVIGAALTVYFFIGRFFSRLISEYRSDIEVADKRVVSLLNDEEIANLKHDDKVNRIIIGALLTIIIVCMLFLTAKTMLGKIKDNETDSRNRSYSYSYRYSSSSSSGSKAASRGNYGSYQYHGSSSPDPEFKVDDFTDPEDFYDWYWDDFVDYEEAEEYYYNHGGR